jgi:hypothetical protein
MEEGEQEREYKWDLMQEQKHFLRVSYVLYSYKILYIFR